MFGESFVLAYSKEVPMVCPVCHGQMIKTKARPVDACPKSIRCVHCRFVIYYKGVAAA